MQKVETICIITTRYCIHNIKKTPNGPFFADTYTVATSGHGKHTAEELLQQSLGLVGEISHILTYPETVRSLARTPDGGEKFRPLNLPN